MTTNIQTIEPERILVRITADMTLGEAIKIAEVINKSETPYYGVASDFARAIAQAVAMASERLTVPLERK